MKLMTALAVFALSTGLAWGAPDAPKAKKAPTEKQLAQQERMKTCNADAGKRELKGDPRKAFMKDCLAGKSAAAPAVEPASQKDKMKICNAEAGQKALKGDDRKKFMSDCLKAK
ncbi:MAG: PsiF family protein [Candidatus Accumulibacter sp.]|jgi:hypothetical protein|nr:PsiF family protein [Accumulibacter sp.]